MHALIASFHRTTSLPIFGETSQELARIQGFPLEHGKTVFSRAAMARIIESHPDLASLSSPELPISAGHRALASMLTYSQDYTIQLLG